MTKLTVHNIDDVIKEQLEINTMQYNCFVEEVCRILKQALFATEQPKKLWRYYPKPHAVMIKA